MTKKSMDKATQEKLLELVKQNYKDIAEDFDITRKKVLWPELVKLAGEVKDGDKVLDVGCGNGRLLRAFAEKKIEYVGVDSSEKLIKLARKKYVREIAASPSTAPRNDKKFLVGDILELDKLPDKNFDYVFCAAVLHHLPGEDLRLEALRQMKGKLAPNGKIIISVWNLWSRNKFLKLIFKYNALKIIGRNKMDFNDILFSWKNSRGEKVSRRYYHAFTKSELKKLATAAGLKLEKIYHGKHNYYLILSKRA